jgi:hypothetical protein
MTIIRSVTSTGWLAGAAVAAGLLAVSCTASQAPPVPGGSASVSTPPAGSASARVLPLRTISTLRTLFNRADGHARLVLIFSPT